MASSPPSSKCLDMVVDRQGRAYVGNFGFDLPAKAEVKPTVLILVTPEGSARIVAEGLALPNGSAITPDGRTLIVGETFAARLTAFTIGADGSQREKSTALKSGRIESVGVDVPGAGLP